MTHLPVQVSDEEVKKERLPLAEGSSHRDNNHLPVSYLLREQYLLQSLMVQLKRVVRLGHHDLKVESSWKREREGGKERGKRGGGEWRKKEKEEKGKLGGPSTRGNSGCQLLVLIERYTAEFAEVTVELHCTHLDGLGMVIVGENLC